MANTIKRVALVGATGGLGAFAIKHLKNDFDITIVTRPDSTATPPEGFKVVKVDNSDVDAIAEAFKGQDAVVMMLGLFQTPLQEAFIKGAAKAGVKRFIPGEYGFDSTNPKVVEITGFMAFKDQSLGWVKEQAAATGMTWTAIVTGAFLDWAFDIDFVDIDVKKRTATLFDSNEVHKVDFTTRDQVARAIAGVLKHPEESENRYVYVNSFQLSNADLVHAIEKVVGGDEAFTITEGSTYELEKQGKDKVAKGDQSGYFDLINVVRWRKGAGCDYSSQRKLDNEVLGLTEKEDLYAILRSALKL